MTFPALPAEMRSRLRWMVAAASLSLVAGASDSEPHYHDGKLTRYELGPPSVLLSDADEAKLRSGKPVMQVLEDELGARRLVMVQDIAVPPQIVFGRICDTNNYAQMVDGVNLCANYDTAQAEGGLRTVKSTYEIAVMHLKFKYFMTHQVDPAQHCMTFHLDYDRKSDIDDSVGYWYVMNQGRQSSRVYYSCECKLRGWVPSPVYNVMTKEALKKATTWVEREAVKEWRAMRPGPGDALVRFVSDMRANMEQMQLPQLHLQPLNPQLLQPPRLVSNWLQGRKPLRSAVRFVSAARPRKQPSSL